MYPIHTFSHQRGSTLIETMVAVLLVAIGIVGMAALQAKTLRNAYSSQQRQQAVLNIHSLFESMQAAVDNRAAGQSIQNALAPFNLARTCAVPQAPNTPATQWLASLKQTIGANADNDGVCGTITCQTVQRGNPARTVTECTATVEWNDEGGSNDRSANARNPRQTSLQSTIAF